MKNKETKVATEPSFGPQSAHVWKALAETCTKDTMKSLEQKFREYGCMSLSPGQAKVIEAMIYGVIIGAYHNVAEEAVEGTDVTGALHAGDVYRSGSPTGAVGKLFMPNLKTVSSRKVMHEKSEGVAPVRVQPVVRRHRMKILHQFRGVVLGLTTVKGMPIALTEKGLYQMTNGNRWRKISVTPNDQAETSARSGKE